MQVVFPFKDSLKASVPMITLTCSAFIDLFNLTNIPFALILASLYHWSLYRPDLILFLPLIFLGLIMDAIEGNPLGQTSFELLVLYGILLTQRPFLAKSSFLMVWTGFSAFVAVALGLKALLIFLLSGRSYPFLLLLLQFCFAVATYPFFSRLISLLHTALFKDDLHVT